MTTRKLVAEEVAEAFRPIGIWQFAAPIERGIDLELAMLDTLATLAFWGWSVSASRARGRWVLQAAKTVGHQAIKARVEGVTYADALWRLGNRLEAVLAGADLDDDDLKAAA